MKLFVTLLLITATFCRLDTGVKTDLTTCPAGSHNKGGTCVSNSEQCKSGEYDATTGNCKSCKWNYWRETDTVNGVEVGYCDNWPGWVWVLASLALVASLMILPFLIWWLCKLCIQGNCNCHSEWCLTKCPCVKKACKCCCVPELEDASARNSITKADVLHYDKLHHVDVQAPKPVQGHVETHYGAPVTRTVYQEPHVVEMQPRVVHTDVHYSTPDKRVDVTVNREVNYDPYHYNNSGMTRPVGGQKFVEYGLFNKAAGVNNTTTSTVRNPLHQGGARGTSFTTYTGHGQNVSSNNYGNNSSTRVNSNNPFYSQPKF